jgi:hypothetical protein
VVSASISANTPLNGVTWTDQVAINGQMTTETVHLNLAGPRYFETMGTPLVVGRDFGQGDRAGTPATAIVNEAFVRKYLSGSSPLGQRLTITIPSSAIAEIVGVVASTVARNLREEAPPFVYLPYFQYGDQITSGTFEIRVQGSLTLTAAGSDWAATSTFSNFILTPGQTYYLQVEAINYGGPGALIGQFDLSDTGFQFANGSQAILTDATNWLAIYNNANSNPNAQQPWAKPTGSVDNVGTNGVGPWGTRPGINGNADWIDGAILGLSDCQNCTVDFSTPITSNSSAAPEPGTLGLLGGALTGFLTLVRRRVMR